MNGMSERPESVPALDPAPTGRGKISGCSAAGGVLTLHQSLVQGCLRGLGLKTTRMGRRPRKHTDEGPLKVKILPRGPPFAG